MSEDYFYKAKVTVIYTDDKGKQKKKSFNYLVSAVNPTDVEVKINKEFENMVQYESYELTSVSLQNYVCILK